MKTCSKCEVEKPISEFSKHRGLKDGHQAWCKKCLGERNRRWFAENVERKRELNRRWRKYNADRVLSLRRKRYSERADVILAQKRAWYAKQSAEAIRDRNRRRNLSRYGFTEKDYRDLLAKQGGGCAVCGAKHGKRKLSVDHCHDSNKVRGILCDGCNIGIGCLGDSPDRLRAAAKYLESIDRSAEE